MKKLRKVPSGGPTVLRGQPCLKGNPRVAKTVRLHKRNAETWLQNSDIKVRGIFQKQSCSTTYRPTILTSAKLSYLDLVNIPKTKLSNNLRSNNFDIGLAFLYGPCEYSKNKSVQQPPVQQFWPWPSFLIWTLRIFRKQNCSSTSGPTILTLA